MKFSKAHWGYILIIFLCLNITIYKFQHKTQSIHAPESGAINSGHDDERVLGYDDQVGALPEILIRNISSTWKLLLLVSVNTENLSDKLYYIDVLSRQYRAQGLEIAIICNGTAQDAEIIKKEFKLAVPVLGDLSQDFQNLSRRIWGRQGGGLVIISDDLKLKFSDFRMPESDQLRVLVEKYLLGVVDYSYYSPEPHAFFQKDQKFPALKLEQLEDGKEQIVESEDLVNKKIVLFLANCPACKLAQYINYLSEVESTKSIEEAGIVAIFTSNFSVDKLKRQVRESKVKAKMYILRGEVSTLHDETKTRFQTLGQEPLIVTLDNKGVIRDISSLKTFYK